MGGAGKDREGNKQGRGFSGGQALSYCLSYTSELVPPPGGGVSILCTCQGLSAASITTEGDEL